MQKWQKTEIKPAAAAAFFLQCPSFGTDLYRNSTKGGALALKIQLVGGAGLLRQKRLTLRTRLRYFKNSDHCIKCTVKSGIVVMG